MSDSSKPRLAKWYIEWLQEHGYGIGEYVPRQKPPRLTKEDMIKFVEENKLSCCNTPLDEYRRCSECGEGC